MYNLENANQFRQYWFSNQICKTFEQMFMLGDTVPLHQTTKPCTNNYIKQGTRLCTCSITEL